MLQYQTTYGTRASFYSFPVTLRLAARSLCSSSRLPTRRQPARSSRTSKRATPTTCAGKLRQYFILPETARGMVETPGSWWLVARSGPLPARSTQFWMCVAETWWPRDSADSIADICLRGHWPSPPLSGVGCRHRLGVGVGTKGDPLRTLVEGALVHVFCSLCLPTE